MTATALTIDRSHRRLAYGGGAIVLLIAAVATAISGGTGYWQLAAFGLGPDVALFLGIGRDLERGRLHPRAVPLYNLLHRFWLPLALGVAAAIGLLSTGYLVAALIWAFHASLDRAVGYGLRTRDGYQRA
jgi:Domain of unknown function (DUF4260)